MYLLLICVQVISDNSSGLLFKNKRDRKIVTVDPKVNIMLLYPCDSRPPLFMMLDDHLL